MAKASFMSMRWLRLHIKEIIWATVTLFVLSCFIIGYGTSRAARSQEDRQKRADAAEKRKQDKADAIPPEVEARLNLPAVHISLPTPTASVTQAINIGSLYQALISTNEYRRLMTIPAQMRAAFGAQIKESVLDSLILQNLVQMYAQANKLQPQVTPTALVERDRQQLSPVEFDRRLKQEGITIQEYGQQRLLQETMQAVFQSVSQPMPPASATEETVKQYYEANKIRFRKEDEISFKHLLVAAADFSDKVTIAEDKLKAYYDEHRNDYMTSPRMSVYHIMIEPTSPDYRGSIQIDEAEVRRQYTERLAEFKQAEQVKARHILIKPRNTFEKTLDNVTVSLRNFQVIPPKDNNKSLYQFSIGLSEMKSGMNLKLEDFTLVTEDGRRLHPTAESMKLVENPLELPAVASAKHSLMGAVVILLDQMTEATASSTPVSLEIRDGQSTHAFPVAGAHDLEQAFAAAKGEIETIQGRLNNKEDFAKIASDLSDDTGSKKDGGSLGSFPRGQMVKPFEEAAFSTPVGEVTGPIRTQFGYHLIKVEGKTPERTPPLDEVRAKLGEDIRTERAELRAQNDLEIAREQLESKTHTPLELVKKLSMGSTRKDNGKLPVFFRGEITEGDYDPAQKATLEKEIGDRALPAERGSESIRILAEIEDAVFALKTPQEVSPVIRTTTTGPDGKPVVRLHLFQLDSILPPVAMTFNTVVKAKIRSLLEEKERMQLANQTAAQIAAKITPENFSAIASESAPAGSAEVGPLPFSANPGFTSFALTSAVGQITVDGHTYLPAIHKALVDLIKSPAEAGTVPKKVLGPIETELGYHFLLVTEYKTNRFTPLAEMSEDLRRMLVQEPTEADIQKDFEKARDKFDTPPTRKIREIIVSDEGLAKEIHQRLVAGELFALLAKKYSIDGSGPNGGLLGEIRKGQFPANLEEAIWKLNKGEFTGPIETTYGWVIALLEEAEKPGQKAELTPDIRTKIKQKLRQEYKQEAVKSFLDGLKNQAYVVRHPENLSCL